MVVVNGNSSRYGGVCSGKCTLVVKVLLMAFYTINDENDDHYYTGDDNDNDTDMNDNT